MSFFGGAASTVGGGGFRFSAPSNNSNAAGASSSSAAMMTLSTANGAPPLTMQVLQKSTRPKLQMLNTQLNSCRTRAATVVKGSSSQKAFNTQYTNLLQLLGTAVRDIDDELFAAVEAQNFASSSNNKLDPKKVPNAVTIHSLAKDLAVHITSAKGVSLGIPYLELISKSALASVVEKETAHERTTNGGAMMGGDAKDAKNKNKKQQQQQQNPMGATNMSQLQTLAAAAALQRTAAAANNSNNTNINTSGSGNRNNLPSPSMVPRGAVFVEGLPSPLQRPVGEAMRGSGGGGAVDDFMPPLLALPGTTASASVPLHVRVQDNQALLQVVQPWLIPYPFSHGTRTERVQSMRSSVAKTQRVWYAVQRFIRRHPKIAQSIVESMPPSLVAQHSGGGKQRHNHHGTSPVLGPSATAAGNIPPDTFLPYILAQSGLSRSEYYGLAPKILEISACGSATEMLSRWEEREGVFDIFLNAPSVGTDTLGQVSSINANANPAEGAVEGGVGGGNAAAGVGGGALGAKQKSQGSHVALAMRTGQLASIDNSQLFLGSPTLKPIHHTTPPLRPAEGPFASSTVAMTRLSSGGRGGGEPTPLVLASSDPYFGMGEEDELAAFSLDGGSAPFSASSATATAVGGAVVYGAAGGATAAVPRPARFFPHRCSNPLLSSKPIRSAPVNSNTSGGANNNNRKSGNTFTVTNTGTNAAISGRQQGYAKEPALGEFRLSNSPAMAGQKRPRGDDRDGDGADNDIYVHTSSMYDMSPLTFGIDPVVEESAAAVGNHNGMPQSSPHPYKPGKGGSVPGIRSSSNGAATPPLRSLADDQSPATAARRPPRTEPQSFMTVSTRVMTCLLHFGVVTTELPMVASGPQQTNEKKKDHNHHNHNHHHGARHHHHK